MARDKQTGAEFNADWSKLLQVGGPPLLLEPVEATLLLSGSVPASVTPLDGYGVPTEMSVPIAADGKDQIRLDVSRIEYWIGQGAQPSDRVKSLIKGYKKAEGSAPAAEVKAAPEEAVEAAAPEEETADAASEGPAADAAAEVEAAPEEDAADAGDAAEKDKE